MFADIKLLRNMGVNEYEKVFNITLRHTLK